MLFIFILFFTSFPLVGTVGAEEAGSVNVESHKKPVRGRLERVSDESIQGLKWEREDELVIHLLGAKDSGESLYGVELQGQWTRSEETSLIFQPQITPQNPLLERVAIMEPKQKFSVIVPVELGKTQIFIRNVNPLGQIESEMIQIVLSDQGELPTERLILRHSYLLSLGPSLISYRQMDLGDFDSTVMTLKASYQYWLAPRRWDLGIVGFGTLFPLTRSRGNVTARFFGLNVRAGYTLPSVRDPWTLRILAGVYYTTMVVQPAVFGFRNMGGPQVFPTLRRALDQRDAVFGYLKFSPVSSGSSPLSFENRELAAGLGWSRQRGDLSQFAVTADYSNLALNVKGVEIDSSSFSLAVGYGW